MVQVDDFLGCSAGIPWLSHEPSDGRRLACDMPAMAYLPRLSLHCLLGGHEPLMRQKRDDVGRPIKPHVLIWECGKCHRELGETALGAKWNLLAKLRRQRTPAQTSTNAMKGVGATVRVMMTTTDATRSSAQPSSADRIISAVPGHARR